jgi:hypothetical protein
MVTQNENPQESRPPTLKDLVDLCRHLNEKKAKYIVIGGMAIVYHGFVRATEDIDLLIETSLENERAVIEALKTLPDSAAGELQPGEIAQYEVIRVADEIVVDLMKKACGIEYAAASRNIVNVVIQGVTIPFADVALMIQLKQSVRLKDQIDLQYLTALKKDE